MTRRRLILAACVAVAALGAGWWWYSGRLTAEELRLIGKWSSGPGDDYRTWTFRPDRTMTTEGFIRSPGDAPNETCWSGECRWAGGQNVLYLDSEQSEARRAIRPLLQLFGVSVGEKWLLTVESLTDDQMAIVETDGTRRVWTRDRGD
jgi:hypothetical protein